MCEVNYVLDEEFPFALPSSPWFFETWFSYFFIMTLQYYFVYNFTFKTLVDEFLQELVDEHSDGDMHSILKEFLLDMLVIISILYEKPL